jgi:integrase
MMTGLAQDSLSQWKASRKCYLFAEILTMIMRWLIALISDTGMRLGEAAGLLKEDKVE